MNKKNFMARSWFTPAQSASQFTQELSHEEASSYEEYPSFSNEAALEAQSPLIKNYFVPGWKGESLISKDSKSFTEILNKLHFDAKRMFYAKEELSRKLKISIYDEFLSYAEFKAVNCTQLENSTIFWTELKKSHSQYQKEIEQFLDILSFRIAVVYLLKIRFILTLQEQTHTEFDFKNIFYPNSYLSKVFKVASSTELKTKVFEQNIFSWYRPHESLKSDLLKFKNICSNLEITEIIKTISLKSEAILELKTDYSHSLSHKSFGLFLNSLLLNFPQWLDSLNKKSFSSYSTPSPMEVISTKFSGDNLESLALSHWLAQKQNKDIKWDQILCPDFEKSGFFDGLYLKTIHELQFLTFLASVAALQNHEPRSFICKTVNSHLSNKKKSSDTQESLIFNEHNDTGSTYDRIILNLNNFPKNNPQHFLFSQITSQKELMKKRSVLYVITQKKLFVPSQKNKIEMLLNDFKIEGIFNLEEVKGKGEVGSHIYIFSKRSNDFSTQQNKHACLNFRFYAPLESFQEFSNITNLTDTFFTSHANDIPPLHQNTFGNAKLEFYQDAIVNGQLIHSSSKDSTKVTHPLFFKKLVSLCHSLDYFFDIQNIDFNEFEKEEEEQDSLFNFSQSFKREKSPYIFIVDQRNKCDVNIEIIPTQTLEVKSYEYGHALCSYFYAYPKWPYLNVSTIRDYFESSVGQQIIHLTFSNEMRKVKGSLNKIFIPKYFTNSEEIPQHILTGLKLLSLSPKDILDMHPAKLEQDYQTIKSILPSLVKTYPSRTLELLANFKRSIYNSLELINSKKSSSSINFNNPIVKTPLLMSKTFPIYPENKEVFVEFNTDALELIHKPLEKLKRVVIKKDDYTNYGIEMIAQGQSVLSIYSDESMVQFIEYLLSNIIEVPISKILQGVQVPTIEDLKSILSSYNLLKTKLTKMNDQLPHDFNILINSTILSRQ